MIGGLSAVHTAARDSAPSRTTVIAQEVSRVPERDRLREFGPIAC